MDDATPDRALARFASVLADMDDQEMLTARLCEAGRVALDAHGAALTVDLLYGQRMLLFATDELSERLEELQNLVGEGPGPEASRTGQIVVGTVGETGFARWPLLASLAEDAHIVGTVYAVPLRPGSIVIGVLTLRRAHGDLAHGLDSVQFIADAIGSALLQDPDVTSIDGTDDSSWSSRAQFHQATGMVVAQLGVSPDDAVALLRAHAYALNESLQHIAEMVVSRRVDFTDFTVGGD